MSITREDLDIELQNWLDARPTHQTVIVLTTITATMSDHVALCERTGARMVQTMSRGGVLVLEVSREALQALMGDPLVEAVEKPGVKTTMLTSSPG